MGQHKLEIVKYINDPVYGGIPVTALEMELISTPVFQRLRGLRQLARVNYVFPGAEHSRFVHSLGVLYIMGLMVEHLMKQYPNDFTAEDAIKMRVAALLHDIGHYPFSHLGECVYSYCKDNEFAEKIGVKKQNESIHVLASAYSKSAHHEHLGAYIVKTNVEIKNILKKNGLTPEEIGEIFTGEYGIRNRVYSQLLHSSLDADRLDYLLRDSYQTGVKYGLVDLQYLIRILMIVEDPDSATPDNNKVLVCNKKGQHVVEHFLMSRYFHYSQVIFHKTNASFEGMIKAMYIKLLEANAFVFNSLDEIHGNVNDNSFLNFNDAFLETALENYYKSTNDLEYKKLYEMYRDRIRPKVVFELKDLYDSHPMDKFSTLKWMLKKDPNRIGELLQTDKWGYQIANIDIEKIHGAYSISEALKNHDTDMMEAVKVYSNGKISYLAEDNLSIINKLSNYKSEFIRIYVLEEEGTICKYDEMTNLISKEITS